MYNWVMGPLLKIVEEYKGKPREESKSSRCEHAPILTGQCHVRANRERMS